jgi:hypothetical protein
MQLDRTINVLLLFGISFAFAGLSLLLFNYHFIGIVILQIALVLFAIAIIGTAWFCLFLNEQTPPQRIIHEYQPSAPSPPLSAEEHTNMV